MGLSLVISLVGLALFASHMGLSMRMHLVGLAGLLGMRQVIHSEE